MRGEKKAQFCRMLEYAAATGAQDARCCLPTESLVEIGDNMGHGDSGPPCLLTSCFNAQKSPQEDIIQARYRSRSTVKGAQGRWLRVKERPEFIDRPVMGLVVDTGKVGRSAKH